VTAAGPNHATEFLGTYIYTQSIPQGHVGYGAALSIMLLLVAIVMAVVSGMRNRRAA
jgi:ABC-type sugar transport system permease subunit